MIQKIINGSVLLIAIFFTSLPIYRTAATEFHSAPASSAKPQYELGPQDRVTVKVYEWRPARDEIYEWTAFNAEYIVDAAGTLSLPLLGDMPAEGVSPSDLSKNIAERLKDKMGLMGTPDVTVQVVKFRPFYIVGAVDKPGEYAYRPGLSVLEAYAIAGGKPRNVLEGARLEREAIATRGELSGLTLEIKSLTVHMARLKAELANADAIDLPHDVQASAVADGIDQTIKQEQLVFDMRKESFRTQINALEQLNSYLEQEAASLEKQLDVHKIEVTSVKAEYDMVQKLYQKGLTPVPRKLALERSMAQIDGDRLRLESSLMRARQEVGRTKIAMIDLKAKRSSDVSTEMQTTQARLDELNSKMRTATSLLWDTNNLASQIVSEAGATRPQPVFDILRRGAGTVRERNVPQSEKIQPGDTVFVEQPRIDANSLGTSVQNAPAVTLSASTDRLN